MNNSPFEEGDVVQLKSGGHSMTVGGEDFSGDIICYWFPKNAASAKRESFPASTLTKIEDKPIPKPQQTRWA